MLVRLIMKEKRKSEHLTDKKGPVAKYIKESGLIPSHKKLSAMTPAQEQARQNEERFIEKYRKTGWIILNSTKAGALGGNSTKWD